MRGGPSRPIPRPGGLQSKSLVGMSGGDGSLLSESLVGTGSAAATPVGVRYRELRLISHQGSSQSGCVQARTHDTTSYCVHALTLGFSRNNDSQDYGKSSGNHAQSCYDRVGIVKHLSAPSLPSTRPRESGFFEPQRLLEKPLLSLDATKAQTAAAGW